MAMRAESLEVLTRANVPPEQALAFVRVIDLELDARGDTLATKADIQQLEKATRADIQRLEQATRTDIQQLRVEMATKAETSAALKAESTSIRSEIQQLRLEVKADIADTKSELMRFTLTLVIGQFAALMGVVYFLVSALKPLH